MHFSKCIYDKCDIFSRFQVLNVVRLCGFIWEQNTVHFQTKTDHFHAHKHHCKPDFLVLIIMYQWFRSEIEL